MRLLHNHPGQLRTAIFGPAAESPGKGRAFGMVRDRGRSRHEAHEETCTLRAAALFRVVHKDQGPR
jgi:hypothetical protein